MSDASFSYQRTTDDSCFLCGSQAESITQEHVFPKWLQHLYALWNQRIGLLNDTLIQYRSLRIPCCSTCNQGNLSRLESVISSAVASGYEACIALDERLLYLWAGKIYYGMLRKEIDLLRYRAHPDEGSIIPAETLKSFSNLHLFLQGIRGEHEFSANPPYSVLVCNLHDVGTPRNYCFRDSLQHMTLAIRMGEIGIIVALEDVGLTKETYGRYVTEVAGRKLHPIQFDELYAKVVYQISLHEGGVTYITSRSASGQPHVRTHVLGGGYLRVQSQANFSNILRAYVSDWLKSNGDDTQWFVPPNLVPTWLTDKAGQLLLQSLSSWESGEILDT